MKNNIMRTLVIDTPRIDGELLASESEKIEFFLSADRLVIIDPVFKNENVPIIIKKIERNMYELVNYHRDEIALLLKSFLTFDTVLVFKNNLLIAMFNDNFENITMSLNMQI